MQFRTPFQVGLQVDQYGDGLVVLVARPGAARAIVSLYGGADPAPVEARWRAYLGA